MKNPYFQEFEIDLKETKIIGKKDLQELDDIFTTVRFIVTDDESLQQINPPNETVIVMTTKEYEQYQKQNNNSSLIQENISPLFKCDKDENTFILKKSASYSGETYKIIRTIKGWKVKTFSSWIS